MSPCAAPIGIPISMIAFAYSVEFETTLFLAAFAFSILSAVFLVKFLFAMIRRAAVKWHLRERGCEPIKVRWLVLAWFLPGIRSPGTSVWVGATAFRVIYSGPDRCVHRTYCWVGYDVGLVVAPLWSLLSYPLRIEWVKDEIIGQLPPTEVWVDDEIITKKLKDNSQTGNSPEE